MTIDGDLQDDPAEIPRLLAKLDEGYDLVTGWKTHRNDPFARRVLSRDLQHGHRLALRRPPARHELRAQGVPRRRRPRARPLRRAPPVHPRAGARSRLPRHRARRQPPPARARSQPLRHGALRARVPRPADRHVHEPLPPPAAPPLRRSRAAARHDRDRDPRLPDDREDHRRADRQAAAAPARRAARRRRHPVPLARAALRARHEPAPRAAARARRPPRRGSSTRSCGRRGEGALLRDVRPCVPPQHAGRLVPAARGRRRWWSATARSGGATTGRSVSASSRGWPRAEGSLARRSEDDADVVVVGYPGHFDMPAARRAARGRPVVFNPLVSLHDTLVGDRGTLPAPLARGRGPAQRSTTARFAAPTSSSPTRRRTPRSSGRAFGLPEERVAVALVGADEPLFRPGWHPPEPFHVLFVGKLIPLHGLETILAAAALAPEVPFRVVGDGQLARAARLGGPRTSSTSRGSPTRSSPRPTAPPAARSASSGPADKAARVIPNKVFQALACARPVITADTPAARELLTDGVDALLVPPGRSRGARRAPCGRVAADDELAERARRAPGARRSRRARRRTSSASAGGRCSSGRRSAR